MGARQSTTSITKVTGGWHSGNNKPIVGEFYAFGIDLQGISGKQLETVKNRMETVKTQLETQQFEGLTKDGIVGDMLYAGALSYFAANDVGLKVLNRAGQAISYRLPSFGTFSTSLNPIYSFGVPRQVEMSGIMVDMDAVANSLWAKNNDAQLTIATGQQIGMMTSAWEHKIPEMLFTSEENPGEAVSAVKALAIASAEGQRIYQVTKENVDVVLPVLNIDSKVKDEIRDSVTVGKVATVSQNTITVGSWTGMGYIIADSETGAGAYRISGGSDGAYYTGFFTGYFGILSLIAFFANAPVLGLVFLYLTLLFAVGGLSSSFVDPNSFFLGMLCGALYSLAVLEIIALHLIIFAFFLPSVALVSVSVGFLALVGLILAYAGMASFSNRLTCILPGT